jgi:outer membrane protein insertion porin family
LQVVGDFGKVVASLVRPWTGLAVMCQWPVPDERPDRMPVSRLSSTPHPLRRALATLVVAAAALLFVPVPLHAQAPAGEAVNQPIAQVRVTGARTWTPEQIAARLKTSAGKPYNSADTGADLKELGRIMRTARIDTQTTEGGKLVVTFIVTEYPRFRHLQIVGNSKVKTERIETLAKLKAGDVLNETTQNGIQRSIRNEYRAVGMPQAQVNTNLIDVPETSEADLQIVINEGEQVKVGDVVIQGNHSFTAMRLRSHLETKGSWAFLKNYYDDATFEDDLAKLREFYALHGYFDAKVERGLFEIQTVKGEKRVSPVIQVTEGQRYTFGTAEIRGVRLFSQADAKAPFEPLRGKLFDGEAFAAALDKLQSLYQNHGLLTSQIEPNYDYDTEHKILNMTVDVNEQSRIYVGKIKVTRPSLPDDREKKGWFSAWYERVAPPVKDDVIAREVLLEPGKIYNKQLEQDSLRRLAKLGVFENDKLKAYNEPTGEPGTHNMVIEAQEAVTGALSGGVGFGDASGLFVFGQASERNVGGQADVFTASLQLGQRASSASIGFLDRHVADTENSLNSQIYYNTALRPGYKVNSGGVSSELGHPLENNWTAYMMGRIEGVKLSHRDGYGDAEERLDRVYPVVTGRLRIEQDTRLPLGRTPREGYLQSYGLEGGYAGAPLLRLEASRDQYFTLTDKLTYRLAASGGLMPYDSNTVPIEERYFLGGNNDMRGFRYRGAGYFDDKEDRLPIGGAGKLLAKNELLFPIYDPVSGVLFTDVGTLGKSPVSWQVPRVSSGAGLRFDLKNVQVGLDLAVPVVKQSDDQTRFFHFSLQSQF